LIDNTNPFVEFDSMVVDTKTNGERVPCNFYEADDELSID